MKHKIVVKFLSAISGLVSASMILPWLCAVRAGTKDAHALLWSMVAGLMLSGLMYLYSKDAKNSDLGAREAFVCVSLAWVVASLIGSMPFMFSKCCKTFTDAFFETMSGFSTTGASIFTKVEHLPHGILLWRALTQWLGGMGIVVLLIALIPMFGGGLAHLFKAESPGPVLEKTNPTINSMSQNLWNAYLAVTILCFVLLKLGGMSIFDSLCHAFSTVSTGGFSTKNASIGHFNSAYIDYALSFVMLICGINFSLHLALVAKRTLKVYKDAECIFFLKLVCFATFAVTAILLYSHTYKAFSMAFRKALFQVASLVTTTGYGTADFSLWPSAAMLILFLLMLSGGSAGSTSGGIKCIRIYAGLQSIKSEFKRFVHPNAVVPVHIGDSVIDTKVASSSTVFCMLYFFVFVISAFIITLTGEDLLVSISSVAATLSNIGPGFGKVGPAGNFSTLSPIAKWVCSFCMLTGRLELYTVLVLFSKDEWVK